MGAAEERESEAVVSNELVKSGEEGGREVVRGSGRWGRGEERKVSESDPTRAPWRVLEWAIERVPSLLSTPLVAAELIEGVWVGFVFVRSRAEVAAGTRVV